MYYPHSDTSTKGIVGLDKHHVPEREFNNHDIIFQQLNPSMSYILTNPLKMCLSPR